MFLTAPYRCWAWLTALDALPCPVPFAQDGLSLGPILKTPGSSVKSFALTQYPRCPQVRPFPSRDRAASAAPAACCVQCAIPLVFPARHAQDMSNASMYWQQNDCEFVDRSQIPIMGYSLRTPLWRYVGSAERRTCAREREGRGDRERRKGNKHVP